METTIAIDKDVLKEVECFCETTIVRCMNDVGMSFPAMGFILQSIINAVEDAYERLDED